MASKPSSSKSPASHKKIPAKFPKFSDDEMEYIRHKLADCFYSNPNNEQIMNTTKIITLLTLNDKNLYRNIKKYCQNTHLFTLYHDYKLYGKANILIHNEALYYKLYHNDNDKHYDKSGIPLTAISKITIGDKIITEYTINTICCVTIHRKDGKTLDLSYPTDASKIRIFAAYLEGLRFHYQSIEECDWASSPSSAISDGNFVRKIMMRDLKSEREIRMRSVAEQFEQDSEEIISKLKEHLKDRDDEILKLEYENDRLENLVEEQKEQEDFIMRMNKSLGFE